MGGCRVSIGPEPMELVVDANTISSEYSASMQLRKLKRS
jgi:hypothetical protein